MEVLSGVVYNNLVALPQVVGFCFLCLYLVNYCSDYSGKSNGIVVLVFSISAVTSCEELLEVD